MKYILLLCLLFLSVITTAQERYLTRTATIDFVGSVPSFEKIEAVNKNATVVLDMETGNLAALALVRGFRFPIALMEEHFNENYIESEKHPKASLRGQLQDFDASRLNSSPSILTFEGSLEMHGTIKELSFPVTLVKNGALIKVNTNFKLRPQDFKIDIPSVVSNKIAKKIEVIVDAQLSK